MRLMTSFPTENKAQLSERRSELTREGAILISDLESAFTDYCNSNDHALLLEKVCPILSGASKSSNLRTVSEGIETLSIQIGDCDYHLNPVETKFKIYSAITAILIGLDQPNSNEVLVGNESISMGTELLNTTKEKTRRALESLVEMGDLSRDADLDKLPLAIAEPLSTITLLLPKKAQAIIKDIMPELVPDITIE